MGDIKLNFERTSKTVSRETIASYMADAKKANKALHNKSGAGNDFLGWVNLPSSIDTNTINEIEETAKLVQSNSDAVIVIGIGGSYLGAKAVYEALNDTFADMKPAQFPRMIFAGQNIGEDYLSELIELLDTISYSIIVISKSGTTTEPAIAFRLLKEHLEAKVGKDDAQQRIIAVTDAKKGALRQLADENGYKTYVIPDDVGGRFSVFTPVGLVALACCGINITELVKGAQLMEKECAADIDFSDNLAEQYACVRNALYAKGKNIEILANFNNKLHYVSEWWKQLYGESEGKENKGIFPASVDLTADLHSMGQYIQEGERTLFETVISVKNTNHELFIPSDDKNLDSLNYLANKNIDYVNKMAELGTALAHVEGGVPNIQIEIENLSENSIGQLLYFFEKACGISGYLLKVNPFNQPGVEAYKKNMFALLEKPGFEEATKEIKQKIN